VEALLIEHNSSRLDRTGSLVPPTGWLDDEARDRQHPGWGFLILLTILALALRVLRLDGMSLWVDEIFTWNLVAPGPGAAFVPNIMDAYQGPLYHAAAWPLVRIAETASMLRLPSALAGALSVPLVGLFTARLWGRGAGRTATVLMLLSPFSLWYSQEARGYSFLIFFGAASGLALLDALRLGLTPARAVGMALLVFGGLASNFAFLFLLVAFGLTVLLLAPPRCLRDWMLWAVALGGGLLLAAPWLLKAAGIWEVGRVVPGADTGQALRGETTFSLWALPFTGFSLFYGFSLGPSLAELHAVDRLAVVRGHGVLIGLAAVLVAIPLLTAVSRLGRGRWMTVLWIVVPLVGVVLLAMRNVKPYNVRYVAVVLPWLLALVAAGLDRLAASDAECGHRAAHGGLVAGLSFRFAFRQGRPSRCGALGHGEEPDPGAGGGPFAGAVAHSRPGGAPLLAGGHEGHGLLG